MSGLARRIAPAAALGGLALVIVGVADPALAGHTDTTATGSAGVATGTTTTSGNSGTSESTNSAGSAGTATSADCANGQTVTGDAYQTRWGPVQVAGTVVNGKLCEAHAVAWPSSDGRSMQINSYAVPQLDAQMAQNGTIDGVSGATYTSQGYYFSLQSILDSL
jgi:uncharacterized protein with FMN-binding domain